MAQRAEFRRMAEEAMAALPEPFLSAAAGVVIQVVDWPSDDTLDSLGIESPYGLLGLYHGVGLPFKSVMDTPHAPDMIQLYRMPILAYCEDTGEAIGDVIRHVLIHEIGHHFGFSDEDMEEIESKV